MCLRNLISNVRLGTGYTNIETIRLEPKQQKKLVAYISFFTVIDLSMDHLKSKIALFQLRIEVSRCQSKSKRSGLQYRKAAMQSKNVCRTHGGALTGPRTFVGRLRCAEAKTVDGRETLAIRSKRDAKLRELREMEQTLKNAGLII